MGDETGGDSQIVHEEEQNVGFVDVLAVTMTTVN
jgi:hypothetical protein